ncbi:hypothetical protein AB751O23_AB_00350 [Chlamydiales bacterium SCGC AB-751-O23]|nr:hypothetical protein AB751O23_AB_00350 [Chlamydiales bacterium SCGC AB-751-O23]
MIIFLIINDFNKKMEKKDFLNYLVFMIFFKKTLTKGKA